MQGSVDKVNARDRLSGPGPDRRLPSRFSRTLSPYASLSQQTVNHGGSEVPEPTKLYLSNLDYDVTNDDVKILFSEVGNLKFHSIHYDKSGRSKGTAEVVYEQHSDAMQAIKRYNNCLLDGKPLKIELVGLQHRAADLPSNWAGILGEPNIPKISVYGHGKNSGWVSYGSSVAGIGHGRAKFPGQRMKSNEKILTAQELDAELERYHLEALELE